MKRKLIIGVLLCLLFASCSKEEVYTYKVYRQDFVNDFIINGTVEAKDPVHISPPKIYNATISYIIEDGTNVKKGDTLCLLSSDRYTNDLINEEDQLTSLKADKVKALANIKLNYLMLEANVRNNDIQSAITEMDSLQKKFSSESQREIINLKLKINKIKKQKLSSQLNAQSVIDKAEIMKINLRIKNKQRIVDKLKKDIESLVVRSSSSGLAMIKESFMGTGKFKVGDMVYYMFPIFEIPNLNNVYVSMRVTETYYKRLAVGQSIKYSFDAMPGVYGYGKVLMKSPGRRKKADKMSYFTIKASLDKCDSLPLPGLSARCKVNINTIKDTLFIPSVSVFSNDGKSFVYLKKGNKFIEHFINTGPQSSRYIVITEGIKDGDVVAMTKPKDKFIIKEEKKIEIKEKNKKKSVESKHNNSSKKYSENSDKKNTRKTKTIKRKIQK